MPSLSSIFKSKLKLSSKDRSSPFPQGPISTYFLAPSHRSTTNTSSSTPSTITNDLNPALTPIEPQDPTQIPPETLLFGLIHPQPTSDKRVTFFLDCMPDPIGFLYHAAYFIHDRLSPFDKDGSGGSKERIKWRHQLILLELEDSDGVAATTGGKIVVSLRWVEAIREQFEKGQRSKEAATKEFKGVLLHELVHCLQHDGSHTAPSWLIESLADLIRLQAHLDPPHWKKPGQGRKEKGWEEGYDSGARFLAWLIGYDEMAQAGPVGSLGQGNFVQQDNEKQGQGEIPPAEQKYDKNQVTTITTQTEAPAPAPTKYHSPLPPPYSETAPHPKPGKKRRSPQPDLIKEIDSALSRSKWDDSWWQELCGEGLEGLWKEYLGYYES